MRVADLHGKRALVTGAAGGLGQAITQALVRGGAQVLMTDMDDEPLDTAAETLGAESLRCDVTSEVEVERAVQRVVDRWGGIDVMVNNAGIDKYDTLADQSADDFARVMAVNTTGVFFGIKHAGRAMTGSGGGAIVNLASVAGLGGLPFGGAYGASKAAVVSLTQTAALELREHKIRVNAVCPGFIDTPMFQRAMEELEPRIGMPALPVINQIQQRLGEPAEVAEAVAFLASDAASFVNGVALAVDNAMTTRIL